MNSPLDGVRVVDFTTTIAGPHCTRLLADLGAEVIKIEAPEGDMMRSRPPLRNGASTCFGQLNTGKKSVVLDLKRPEAVETVQRLVATADVVVENFRPGVMRPLRARLPGAARRSSPSSSIARSRAMARPALGRVAGLCAGDPRRLGLRSGAYRLSGRATAGRIIAASTSPMC